MSKVKIGDLVQINIPPMPEGVGPVTFDKCTPDVCGCYVMGIENERLFLHLCVPHFTLLLHEKLKIIMPCLPTDFGDTGKIPFTARRKPLPKGEDGLFEFDGELGFFT
jgi:hypothetical protein